VPVRGPRSRLTGTWIAIGQGRRRRTFRHVPPALPPRFARLAAINSSGLQPIWAHARRYCRSKYDLMLVGKSERGQYSIPQATHYMSTTRSAERAGTNAANVSSSWTGSALSFGPTALS